MATTGRIRHDGMGKRVDFCGRSVVTCSQYLSASEILLPHPDRPRVPRTSRERVILHRLTVPVTVHQYNLTLLVTRMHGVGLRLNGPCTQRL